MTQSEVKHILGAAGVKHKRYAAARDKADAYRRQLTGRTVRTDDDGGQDSRKNSTEEGYIRLAELDEEADRARREWLDARKEAERLIDMCQVEIWAQVLTYRYLNHYRFESIAAVLGYSDRQIYRAHKKSLQFLAEKMQRCQ